MDLITTRSPRPVYDRLQGSEIRLMRFEGDSSHPSSIRMQLETFELHEAPPYIALSYVWGDARDTQPIDIGSKSLEITRNLFSALLNIRTLSSYFEAGLSQNHDGAEAKLFLWIDAICIDQENVDERSDQVPRMTQIYSSAYSVLIWLGTIEGLDLDLLTFQIFLEKLDMIDPVDGFLAQERPSFQPLVYENSTVVACKLLADYKQIILSTWFRRVWVLQEYVLSQRTPCVMIGQAVFSFQSLHGLAKNLRQLVNHPDLSVDTTVATRFRFDLRFIEYILGPASTREWLVSSEFQEKSLAHQLIWIYMNIGLKYSTIPHDRIYGFLSIVKNKQLPPRLKPNYRQSYEDLCRDFTHHLVEQTRDLRLLAFINNMEPLEGQPSWVVDFRSLGMFSLEPATSGLISFSADGLKMTAEGVISGTIVLLFRETGLEPRQRMQRFYDIVLTASSKIRQQSLPQTWKDWFSGFLVSYGQSTDHADRFASFADFLATFGEDDQDLPEDSFDRKRFMIIFKGCNFALVDDGKVVPCYLRRGQEWNQDWEVVMLKGATQRYVMSRTKGNEFIHVGWLSEVDFTLGGVNYRLYSAGTLDEDFFTKFESEQIVLV
jgi:hypothetical protein